MFTAYQVSQSFQNSGSREFPKNSLCGKILDRNKPNGEIDFI